MNTIDLALLGFMPPPADVQRWRLPNRAGMSGFASWLDSWSSEVTLDDAATGRAGPLVFDEPADPTLYDRTAERATRGPS